MGVFADKKPMWGIDIGSRSLKGIRVARSRSGFRLQNAEILEFSDENPPLADGISELLGPSLSKVQAAIHFSGRVMPEIRTLMLPVMPKKELVEAVRWEARKLSPLPEDEMVVDFLIMGKREAAEAPQYEIVVVIVEKAALVEQLDQIKETGLTVSAVDVSPVALLNTARLHFLGELPMNLLYVDIGAKKMEISIVKNGVIRFTRQLMMGGEAMTHSLSQFLGLSLGEAEKHKRKNGIQFDETTRATLLTQVDRLIVEIQRSVDYYRAQSRNSNIDKILLMGGMPMLPGFLPYFSSFFDAPVELEGALSEMQRKNPDMDALEEMAPRFSLALGLAMREK